MTTLHSSDIALSILKDRYFLKDDDGNPVEDWEKLCRRVSRAVASVEKEEVRAEWQNAFYDLMIDGEFLPNSPTLMNAGLEKGLLSACLVLPIEDSMESIFGTLLKAALVHKAGAGTGYSFSRLRPVDAKVGKHGGTSTGVVSFVSVYDSASNVVKQGGRRRAASMGLLRIDHPEIVGFIKAKELDGVLANFNLSVAITDHFIHKLKTRPSEMALCHHDAVGDCFVLEDGTWVPRDKVMDEAGPKNYLTYEELFGMVCRKAWANGEPGFVFIDTINKTHKHPELGEIEGVNACAEQPLYPYETCNLGSINLAKMVTPNGEIAWDKLVETVQTAVRFLDNVIDTNYYIISEIEQVTKQLRPIGLGPMGFADMLLKMGVRYGSKRSFEIAGQVMEMINLYGHGASKALAREKGEWSPGKEERNCQITTVAPTGTISMIAGCSSGIEPNFRWHYMRKAIDREFTEYHPLYKEYYPDGSPFGVLPNHFVTAGDVGWEEHVKMQAAFQQYVDASISKTINMPPSATIDDVKSAVLMAHELGCKGLTVYRDGSREGQVISGANEKPEQVIGGYTEESWQELPDPADDELPRGAVAGRPKITDGSTAEYAIGCGSVFVTCNHINGDPVEVFVQPSDVGGCAANAKGLGKVISVALRAGVDSEEIIRRLKTVSCPACRGKKGLDAKSCPAAVARAMVELKPQHDKFIEHLDRSAEWKQEVLGGMPRKECPDCGEPCRKEGGCWVCDCGFSKCG